MNRLYLHIAKYFGPVSLERVNPWAQRPKGNSGPPHPLPIHRGMGLQVSRMQAAQEECPVLWCQAQMVPTCRGIWHSWAMLSTVQPERKPALQQHGQKCSCFSWYCQRHPTATNPTFCGSSVRWGTTSPSDRNPLQALTDSLGPRAVWQRPGWWDRPAPVPCPYAGSRSASAGFGHCTGPQS